MKKSKLLSIIIALVLVVVGTSSINAVTFEKEYSDNIQRYVVKSGTKTNLIGKTVEVKPNSKYNLDYKIGSKFASAKYYSSDTKAATVNENNGVISFKKGGDVTITIKGSDKRTFKTKFRITSTYVVVSIQKQNAKLYVNGKLKRTAKVVTGRLGVTDTPTGTFKIAYKQRNTHLDGRPMGYDYYLPVKYWVPLAGTGGVGLHDASWRPYSQFGGTYYKWDGSHGCINMRTKDVAYFYKHIKKGTIVKIY
ncbi:lipoprotein-anchoring transpeptidase ErfK/SrfK [Bacilli bacterium PM5-3]|nr:lipoprotein-anchoring transpeptidase ErfK/SrfK [Bacilli bacterium PM5-3]MDH6603911.1 lipoprotein-anchoring transpeptidase ErfK/SrfK [Bacilli bacterium PM5-9]